MYNFRYLFFYQSFLFDLECIIIVYNDVPDGETESTLSESFELWIPFSSTVPFLVTSFPSLNEMSN